MLPQTLVKPSTNTQAAQKTNAQIEMHEYNFFVFGYFIHKISVIHTILVSEIRKHMPKTRIDGCLAPFTFMNNDIDEIIKEVKRDCFDIKATGTKGLNIYTAGSINFGSSLESLRAVMYAIQNYGKY